MKQEKLLEATGWTYKGFSLKCSGGTLTHEPVWLTPKAFKQMNPSQTPIKIRILAIPDSGKKKKTN